MLHDQVFTLAVRLVRGTGEAGRAPELLSERVTRVFKKRPDKVRGVVLRDWRAKSARSANMDMSFSSRMDEEIVNFAFRPATRREFRYRIVGRDLVGNRLIYRIAFEPRSALDPTVPSGLVWVDTNDFVIVRQEVGFARSPIPLILQGIDRMVIERQRAEGFWVLKRVLLRARTSLPLPTLWRSFDFSLQFDDYAINRGLDDAIFETKAGSE
jgi:hypothetical protein